MKTRITLSLLAVAGIFLLTGCATTLIKDSSLQKRTVSFSILNIVNFEKTTEGLAIGEAELVKEESGEETE